MDNDTINIFGREIETLPISAQLSFALRCVRRTQPLFSGSATHAPRIIEDRVEIPREHIDVLDKSLDAIQRLSAKIHERNGGREELAPDDVDAVYRSSYSIIIRNPRGAAYSDYAFAVFSVNKACQEALKGNAVKALHFLRNASMSALNSVANFYGGEGKFHEVANKAFQYAKSLAMKDLNLLLEAAKEGKWTKTTSIPSSFFSVHSIFDAEMRIGRRTIITIAHLIEERLLETTRRDPGARSNPGSPDFEESIAELFGGFGFFVEFSGITSEGAKSVLAIHNALTKADYLVGCNWSAPGNTVEIAVATRLHGFSSTNGVFDGIVASVSRGYEGAGDSSKRVVWRLEKEKLNVLVEWLDRHQKLQLKEILYFNSEQ